MSVSDESWKDSYDEWKLASPYDDDLEGECQHDEYDTDILSGRATCWNCGASWWQSEDEIQAEIDRQREYDEWCAAQQRLCNRFKEWLGSWLHSLWRRRRRSSETDDEIPF